MLHRLALPWRSRPPTPAYIEDALGERPDSPEERESWRQAVRDIEAYRDEWRIDDPDVALGDEPEDATRRLDRDRVESSIAEVMKTSVEQAVDRSEGIELSLELSL